MKKQTFVPKEFYLSLESDLQTAGNIIDSVIHTLQKVSPNEGKDIQKLLNTMSPSNPSSTSMKDALKIIDKKIKEFDSHGLTPMN